MEETAVTFGIWSGLGVSFGMICIMKYIAYRLKKNDKPFSLIFWLSNNWMEYPVLLFLTWIFFMFDHDLFNVINYLLEKFGSSYELIHFEDKSFWFVITPVVLTVASYKFLRTKTDKAQISLSPHIHDEFCGHDKE